MSFMKFVSFKSLTLASCASLAVMPTAAHAYKEQKVSFNIAAQDLGKALTEFGMQSGKEIYFAERSVTGKKSNPVKGVYTPLAAIKRLLSGSGVVYRVDSNGTILIGRTYASTALSSLAQGANAGGPPNSSNQMVDSNTIVVTAQKREERLQDVPIAITALSSAALDERKIESGGELLRAIPNVNFSKSNFSMYNFSIRGIGTKAISAASDPAVAVSFNNVPLIRNRLFEQEFFDLERVEVLRGPQGTLYGRNATAGVVNIISAQPEPEFGGEVKGGVGSYKTRRLSGMLNVPITDTLGVRVAGAWTKRDGFDYNTVTQRNVNGRDLWSTRATVAWEPSSDFRANFVWQHFEEDDNRSRSGKALCTRDPGPTQVGDTPVGFMYLQSKMSQGCLPKSLYDDAAFGAPNLQGSSQIFAAAVGGIGYDPETGEPVGGLSVANTPYADVVQSRDLREIATSYDPVFRAKNDVFQLNIEIGIGAVGLYSQTTYAKDSYYSSQDYNRFVSAPLFPDSEGLVDIRGDLRPDAPGLTPGGIYTDPQLGPSNRLLSVDISKSENEQWFQELRLTSDIDGPINFNVQCHWCACRSR